MVPAAPLPQSEHQLRARADRLLWHLMQNANYMKKMQRNTMMHRRIESHLVAASQLIKIPEVPAEHAAWECHSTCHNSLKPILMLRVYETKRKYSIRQARRLGNLQFT